MTDTNTPTVAELVASVANAVELTPVQQFLVDEGAPQDKVLLLSKAAGLKAAVTFGYEVPREVACSFKTGYFAKRQKIEVDGVLVPKQGEVPSNYLMSGPGKQKAWTKLGTGEFTSEQRFSAIAMLETLANDALEMASNLAAERDGDDNA